MPDQKPWEKYAAVAPATEETGPWAKYAGEPVAAENLPGATPRLLESARMAPASMTQPTQFEKDRPGKGVSTEGMGDAALESLKQLPSGIVDTMKTYAGFKLLHPSQWPVAQGMREAAAGWKRPSDVRAKIGESIMDFMGPFVGVSGIREAEQAERGEGGAILGEAAVPAATAIASYGIPKMASRIRPALRSAAFKELPSSGGPQLTKGARLAGSLMGSSAGAVGGALTGIPSNAYIGGHAGLLMGPSIMERMIGAPELGDIRNPGPFSKIPLRAPKMVTAKPEAAPSPFTGMTSSEKPIGSAQLPATIPKMGEPPVKMVSKFEKATSPEPSKIIKPGSAEAKPLRVEGSYWSFKEPALRKAVLGGDRDAAVVYKQRFGDLPEGAGLLTDVAQGPTKGLYRSRN